ncbi:MAG: ABC transporter substrate-binding protein [Actinomycetes bacterium]
MTHHRRARIAALLGTLAVAAGGCLGDEVAAPAPAAPAAEVGGSLTVGIEPPASVDPGNAFDRASLLVASTLCDSLLGVDPDTGELVPGLAESWTVSDRGSVVTLKLRNGLTFPDGRALTSQDVVSSLSRAASADLAGLTADLLRPIDGWDEIRGQVEDADDLDRERLRGVRVLTERTVEISLREPNAEFLAVLAHPVAAPLSRVAVEAAPDAARTDPPCIGPYRLAEPFDPAATELVLERVEGHHGTLLGATNGGAGYLDEIRLEVVAGAFDAPSDPAPAPTPSPTDAAAPAATATPTVPPAPEVAPPALDLDGLDLVAVPLRAWDEVEDAPGHELVHTPGPGIDYVGVPVAPLSGGTDLTRSREEQASRERLLRLALSLALDRTAIARDALAGARLPADGFLPPTLRPAGLSPACTETVPPTADPDAARAALEASGLDLQARPLTFAFNDDFANRDLVEAVARQWEDVLGVTVELEATDLDGMLAALGDDATPVDAFRTSWAVPYPSVDGYLYPLFSSSQFGLGNLNRYQDPVLDQLLTDEVRRTEDPADRILLVQQALEVTCRDLPLIPVAAQRLGYAVSDRVASATGAPVGGYLGLPLLRELHVAG